MKFSLTRSVLGAVGGGLFGCFLVYAPPFGAASLNIVGAPAFWLFNQWHELGLPPQGEAALAGPFFAFLIQWTLVGAVVGGFIRWKPRSPFPTVHGDPGDDQ